MRRQNEFDLLNYQHRPLSGPKSIRVLELYPAELGSGEPLRGRLFEVSLDRRRDYEALSYVWGSTDRVEELHCGSSVIRITRNCWQALRRLRWEEKVRYLWIDSICIDQDDCRERNHQVGLMGDVYRQATCVLVWLGKGSEQTDEAIRYLKDVATKAQSSSLRTLLLDVPLDRKIIKVMDHDNEVLEQLTSLFERTWFRRVWPVQEIALSSRCRLLSGGSSISLADFMGALGSLQNVTFTSNSIDQVHFHRKMWKFVNGQKNPKTRTCSDILLRSRFQEAADPKDKVFAFHGLLSELGLQLPDPDYSKSVAFVYTEAVVFTITNSRRLNILAGVTGESNYRCPSWVPDFSNGSPISEITKWHRHDAAGSSLPIYEVRISEGLLTLHGVILDTIKETSEVFRGAKYRRDTVAEAKVLRAWREQFKQYLSWEVMASIFTKLCLPWWGRTSHHMDTPCSRDWWKAIKYFDEDEDEDGTVDEWLLLWAKIHERGYKGRGYRAIFFGDGYGKNLNRSLGVEMPRNTGPLRMHRLLRKLLDRKVFFRTANGRFGIASMMVQPGDKIGLFAGCNLPLIIRRGRTHWRMIAPAYLHGVMNGSQWPRDGRLSEFTFT